MATPTANSDAASVAPSARSLDTRFLENSIGDTEDLDRYEPGGFHPVHLGDILDGRYKVVHKLGSGGFSTVWLVEDQAEHRDSNWLAIKIVVSDETERTKERIEIARKRALSLQSSPTIVVGQKHFYLQGPNGRHICLILPVLGPAASRLSDGLWSRLHPVPARLAAKQAVKILAELHEAGLCHGDATTANFVYGTLSLDGLGVDDIYRMFGQPVTSMVRSEEESGLGPESPRYIVKALDFLAAAQNMIAERMHIIDFDQCFANNAPPSTMLGTPAEFLAPEVAAGGQASPASDVWALGCTISRLRSGHEPFSGYEVTCPVETLRIVGQTLGDYPLPADVVFDEDGQPTTDSAQGRPLNKLEGSRSLKALIQDIYDAPLGSDIVASETKVEEQPTWETEHTPFPAYMSHLAWKPSAVSVRGTYLDSYSDEVSFALEHLPKIDQHEASLLLDLLSGVFRYDTKRRPTARELLSHAWFTLTPDNTVSLSRKRKASDKDEEPVRRSSRRVSPEV